MKKRSVVLLSGGLDSSVNLLAAHKNTEIVLALTFDYGQRAAKKEIASARLQAEKIGVPHQVVELGWLREITKTSLVNHDMDIPVHVAIDSYVETQETAKRVWVPNRNGVFLNIAAAFAESLAADIIIPGFNREEAQTFSDNSESFLNAMTNSLNYSTANQVAVHCYTTTMDKPEIAELGKDLGLDFSLVWPCYFGDDVPCGKCESCLRFKRAVQKIQ